MATSQASEVVQLLRRLNQENVIDAQGKFELDTTKKLKELTIHWLIQWPAIYKLEGDTLTICFNFDANLPRPDEFRTLAGVERVLLVYERAK